MAQTPTKMLENARHAMAAALRCGAFAGPPTENSLRGNFSVCKSHPSDGVPAIIACVPTVQGFALEGCPTMKKIALSLVLATGLSLAACSQPAEEATTEAPEAAAEGTMTEAEATTDAAAPAAEGAMTEAAPTAEGAMTEAAPAAEGAMTEEAK